MTPPEVIKQIKEIDDFWFNNRDRNQYQGYEIITSHQAIRFIISKEPICCEHFGYICTNDNIEDFIGAEVLSISSLNGDGSTTLFTPEYLRGPTYEELKVFLNIDTNRGRLQFVVYNSHNGHYGHRVKIQSSRSSRLNLDREI